MNSNFISVIVPFVNHKEFIEPCQKNISEQTYPFIELIFVDNGSTDGSSEIASNLEKKYPGKVKVISETQKGIPFARNAGLRAATGAYVSFLDVDDLFTHDKLERLHASLLQKPDAAMAYGQTLRIYRQTEKKIIQDKGVAIPGINLPPELALNWTRSFFHLPQTGATLIRTDVAVKEGGFPENMLLGNDDVGFHVLLALKYPVVFEPFIAVEYFRHDKSEGARLNETITVEQRYLDAYANFLFKTGKDYFDATGDIRLWGMAQRGLFNNLWNLRFKKKIALDEFVIPKDTFILYKIMNFIYDVFPFPVAKIIRKIISRIGNVVKAEQYPI